MENICVVVADGKGARIFLLEESAAPRAAVRLLERGTLSNADLRSRGRSVTGRVRTETNTNREAGPVHPMGAQRERHRIELERRFSVEVARKAAALARNWATGSVVIVADPRMLGFLREAVRVALTPGIQVKELAKDYAHLTASRLRDHLTEDGVLPARRGSAT
ncbi:MAG TPA: host attachment protein [Burkholderiales bacterium]|jgi:protein required for attachment to host cells